MFQARARAVLLPGFLLVGLELFLWSIVQIDGRFATLIGVLLTVGTLTLVLGILCSSLYLHAEDGLFSATVRLFGWTVFRREARGRSWHAVSFPSASVDPGPNDFTPYRVEVADENGNRILMMGKLSGYIYGVDCL